MGSKTGEEPVPSYKRYPLWRRIVAGLLGITL